MIARATRKYLRVVHRPTGSLIAEGPVGWGVMPFDGGYYIQRRHLRAGHFKMSFIPGLCPYKGLYTWMHYHAPDGSVTQGLGWFYFLPNPLFPFIWFRVAVPREHPDLIIDRVVADACPSSHNDDRDQLEPSLSRSSTSSGN